MQKVVLMSGVPGSGKSTYVKRLVGAVVCSADHFFEKSGRYTFDPRLLGEAHGECLAKFTRALLAGESLIIVDNTNTSAIELAPYVALASAFGAECEIVTVKCDPEQAFARNVHGVPLVGIKRMAEAIESRQLPPFWAVKLTEVRAAE